GQRVRLPPFETPTWLTIVGVVSNTPMQRLDEPAPAAQLYLPLMATRAGPPVDALSYVIRASAAPSALLPRVRDATRKIDRDLPLAEVRTLQDTLDPAVGQTAFTMVLLVIASTVALLLGVIGVYGVMSYLVGERTSEIGVRLALGAMPGSVVATIVRQG